jgi:phosphoribosyl 1,2-cyclic phosphodiesterase
MPFIFCPVRSGSSGCVSFVRAGGVRLLVDVGYAARTTESLLRSIGESAANVQGVLITHEHSDHMKGVGTLSKMFDLPVYANEETWSAMNGKPGVDAIADRNRRVFTTGEDFYIGEANIQPFAIPHDAAAPVGYSIVYRGRKISLATDIGRIASDWLECVAESDILLIESNHDPDMLRSCAYPAWLKRRISGNRGHLSNLDCAQALAKLSAEGVRHFVLGHMSAEANLPELAVETASAAISRAARVDIAHREHTGGIYEISC